MQSDKNLNADAFMYAGTTCDVITNRLPGIKVPAAIVLNTGAIDVRRNLQIEAIKYEMERMINTAKRTFPTSKVIVSSIPSAARYYRHCISEVNGHLRNLCSQDQHKLMYIDNEHLELNAGDNIHLTPHSKEKLANAIVAAVMRQETVQGL